MKRLAVLVALLSTVGASAETVLGANTWCFTNFPDAVFCEDFDRYCLDPPPEPEACPIDSPADGDAFINNWVDMSQCSNPLAMDDTNYLSPPWGGRTNTQEKSVLGLVKRPLSDLIRATFGQAYSSIMATDLNPLVLEFAMNGQDFSKITRDNSFLSLGSGFATAPADWVYSDWCAACGSPDPRYPIICQQETPPATCPPIGGAPHVSAIAVGLVAYLDPNPCHCGESGAHSPYNEHLSFFDGHKWYRLRQGLFPGSGDFRLRNRENRIRVTIKSSTIKVELTCIDPNPDEYSWCELPRDYTGCFNSITIGYPVPCRLNEGEWTCRDDPDCALGVPGGAVPAYDNIALYGGMGCGTPGACCHPGVPDYTCTDGYYGDCQTLGGTFKGHDTTCAELTTSCCPPLPADHDDDGDVDMTDFGWFQSCLSGGDVPASTFGCRCADLDPDYDVDQSDFDVFQSCIGGPNVAPGPSCGA